MTKNTTTCRHCGARIDQDDYAWFNGFVHNPENYLGYYCPGNWTHWHEPVTGEQS